MSSAARVGVWGSRRGKKGGGGEIGGVKVLGGERGGELVWRG